MRVTIKAGDDVLHRFSNQLGALGAGDAHKALARAVNRVTNTVHGRVIRAVAKQSSIPTAVVRATVKKRLVKPGSGGALEGVVWATGKPLSLKVFKPRQFSWGIRVKVWGEQRRYPHYFMNVGRWNSGKTGALNGHVWKRVGSDRLPIEKEYGPSVAEELVRGESARIFDEVVATMLPARVAHEIGRLLPQ